MTDETSFFPNNHNELRCTPEQIAQFIGVGNSHLVHSKFKLSILEGVPTFIDTHVKLELREDIKDVSPLITDQMTFTLRVWPNIPLDYQIQELIRMSKSLWRVCELGQAMGHQWTVNDAVDSFKSLLNKRFQW